MDSLRRGGIALAGAKDIGDVFIVRGVTVEAKNCKAMALGEWMTSD